MKLNQIIALVGGRKTAAHQLMTTIHHGWKADRITGMTRSYTPKSDDGERYPPDNKVLQIRVEDELQTVREMLADFWSLVATQEYANTDARGDIVVDGQVLLESIPVSVLLFLDKQLTDLGTMVEKLPVLPVDKVWQRDAGNRCFVSEPEATFKTRKEQKPLVLYPATPEHPAQTQLVTTDETVGMWTTTHLSGALPAAEKFALLRRVATLRDAVKVAREQANSMEAPLSSIGPKLLGWIFAK
jgi:hypothetical protein